MRLLNHNRSDVENVLSAMDLTNALCLTVDLAAGMTTRKSASSGLKNKEENNV